MPKVNVYLSDDLAAAVKEAGIPVSTVCQRALEEALSATTALREGVGPAPSPLADILPADVAGVGGYTARLAVALTKAFNLSPEPQAVTTAHLLIGLLDEGENLALRVLVALNIEPDDLRTELRAALASAEPSAPTRPGSVALDAAGVEVMRLMGEEAARMGHRYVGCEHLLLAVVAEPSGAGGRILRSMGVDLTVARRAVRTALVGFVHGQAKRHEPAVEAALVRIADRLDRIEAALPALS